MEESIALPRVVLPSREMAEQMLARTYPDMEYILEDAGEDWHYRIRPFSRGAVRYDPNLPHNARAQLGISVDEIATWRMLEHYGNILWMEALNHCWALPAWSRWLEGQCEPVVSPLMIHIDAHDDLGNSSLLCSANKSRFAAALGNQAMDLTHPESVYTFVQRGLVGIGSFMLPFLWAVGGCRLVHIIPGWSWLAPECECEYEIRATALTDNLSYGLLHLSPAAAACDTLVSRFHYTRTADLDYLRLSGSKIPPVFLDIDLDYFGLYSARIPPPARHHADLADAFAAVDRVIAALEHAGLSRRLAVITIAYSPGFFPSGWWQSLVPYLRARLHGLLV